VYCQWYNAMWKNSTNMRLLISGTKDIKRN
jgi:hypothetical protein